MGVEIILDLVSGQESLLMGRQDLLVLMVVVILVTINGHATLCTLVDLLLILPLLRLLDLISLGFVVSARC